MKLIANNKRAYHEYFIEEEFEAGIVLIGAEIKSLRQGKANIRESYISIDNLEAFIIGMHISPFEQAGIFNDDPYRKRKLLLSKREIKKLHNKTNLSGYTIVPLRVYINSRGLAKIKIAIAKGKQLYDKRDAKKDKDAKRSIERALKNY